MSVEGESPLASDTAMDTGGDGEMADDAQHEALLQREVTQELLADIPGDVDPVLDEETELPASPEQDASRPGSGEALDQEEEAEEEEAPHLQQPPTSGSRLRSAHSARIPSQAGRAALSRTPAEMDRMSGDDFTRTTSDYDDDDSSVLITELKDDNLPADGPTGEWEGIQLPKGKRAAISGEEEEERDEDYDTDLECDLDPPHEEHDPTGRSTYQKLCDKLGVIPVSYFSRHLTDAEITMRYHGLGAQGTEAIASVLKDNITLERLNLSGNWMEGEGGMHMAQMLVDNDYIAELCLADNKFGALGGYHMAKMMHLNSCLRRLDLSGNNFRNPEAEHFAEAIEANKYLKLLNLSNNNFGIAAGEALGPAISQNDILEHLNLSWNCIRKHGANCLAKGIKENIRLKSVNLGWNGFGPEGGAWISEIIAINDQLQELDVSGNRLDANCAYQISKALKSNETLRTLKIGNNPITTTGAISIITSINDNDNSVVVYLDLTDIPVEFEFLKTVEQVEQKRQFRVLHGRMMRSGNTTQDIGKPGIDPFLTDNPFVVLREHIVINDTKIVDILRGYDTEETYHVTREQFAKACEQLGVKLSQAQLNEVSQKLDKKGDGSIYYGDIANQIETNSGKALPSRMSSRAPTQIED